MTTEQKIIRAKVGLLELAKQLGNVSQACKMMGYSRDSDWYRVFRGAFGLPRFWRCPGFRLH
jgi:molybdenum-dependent DNA-binding transcriptional regulator ModE